jgi:hypothetical protein
VWGLGCGICQLQCTVFDGFCGEVALTAGGGRRRLPLLKDAFEDIALVSPVTVTTFLLLYYRCSIDEHHSYLKILHFPVSALDTV